MILQTEKPIIQVDNVHKSYGKVHAVKGISFHVNKGEIFGFLGPNGAGKTTTLSILEGLQKADAGSIRIFDMDINTHLKQIKQKIGVQLQSTALIPDLTVIEQMRTFATLYGIHLENNDLVAQLSQLGLNNELLAFPDQLSGGQKQRLSLAIALINDPEILFLDEPTTGLDPQSRRTLWDIIHQLRHQGKTIVITTHYMDEAQMLCDRIAIIDHGERIAMDTPQALIESNTQSSIISLKAQESFDLISLNGHVEKIVQEGSSIFIHTNDVQSTLHDIIHFAEQHELDLHDLHIAKPNLEDIFLQLTGHRIRD